MKQIKLRALKPVAFDSLDHIRPHGTASDNSANPKFNQKLLRLTPADEVFVLDLGCAGGAFVKSILDGGGFAIGIEGSDYSKINHRAEWATIPDNLFTADITEPFQLSQICDNTDQKIKFNLITAWEVLEHIRADDLRLVFENINKHLSLNGLVILSISMRPGKFGHHVTIRNKSWWLKKINDFGFINHKKAVAYFCPDWIRGDYDDSENLHLVLSRIGEKQEILNVFRRLPLDVKINISLFGFRMKLIAIKATLIKIYQDIKRKMSK